MNKMLKALLVVSLIGAVSMTADAAQKLGSKDYKEITPVEVDRGLQNVKTPDKGIILSGYVDTSYTYQFTGRSATGNNSGRAAYRSFDTKHNDFNINALKIVLEKPLGQKNELDAGFRADLIFGEDAKILSGTDLATSGASTAVSTVDNNPVSTLLFGSGDTGTGTGFGSTGVYLEQAYVQFRAPIGNGLDFKFGKFATLLGYEVIESPANLNFSRGLLFTNATPLTHTGILASYKFTDSVDGQIGIVNGWNSSDSNVVSTLNAGKAVTARIGWVAPSGNLNAAISGIYSFTGEPGTAGVFNRTGPLATADLVVNYSPMDKLLVGLNAVYGTASKAYTGTYSATSDVWMGAALYTKYQLTPAFSLAARLEWLNSKTGLKIARAARGNDIYSATVTAGIDIWENLLTRVEYRADLANDGSINKKISSSKRWGVQHQVALNMVYSF